MNKIKCQVMMLSSNFTDMGEEYGGLHNEYMQIMKDGNRLFKAQTTGAVGIPQHLYFVSDEKLEINDDCINTKNNEIYYCVDESCNQKDTDKDCRKIIASTEKSLNLPSVPDWFIKEYITNPESNKEVFIESHNYGIVTDSKNEVIILSAPKEVYTLDDIKSAIEYGWNGGFSCKQSLTDFYTWKNVYKKEEEFIQSIQ